MHDNRDDYEPIIADRRPRAPLREETQPLWRLVLALCAGLAVVALLAWWFMGGSSIDGPATTEQSEISAPETLPEEHIEQAPTPPARDVETNAEIAQAPAPPASPAPPTQPAEPAAAAEPATVAEAGASAEPEASTEQSATPNDTAVQTPAPPAEVPVRFMSADAQVRFELRGPLDASPPLASKAGDAISVPPGTYRVVVSGPELETLEQDVTLQGERPLEYTVELCAERRRERENLAGKVVEERSCATTPQCESMFMVLSEHADQLVADRAFRTQQCAKWRANAAPDGRWTLDTKCDGATLATTCRIEIAQGACTFAEPPRSARGTACPRAELKSLEPG